MKFRGGKSYELRNKSKRAIDKNIQETLLSLYIFFTKDQIGANNEQIMGRWILVFGKSKMNSLRIWIRRIFRLDKSNLLNTSKPFIFHPACAYDDSRNAFRD